MANPYQAPISQERLNRSSVAAPATSLMVVSAIAIVLGVFGLIIDFLFIATGFVARLEEINEGPTSEYTTITIRIIWGLILVIASLFVFYGALKMKNLKSYSTALAAAIVSMIPLLGPCCILGIPFGIWAFVTLKNPDVKRLFNEHNVAG